MSSLHWPGEPWTRADPAHQGLDSARLHDMEQVLRTRHSDVKGMMIIRGGLCVFEAYQDGFEPESYCLLASVTKSVISALVGIAIDRGEISGVDQPLLDFFPEYEPKPEESLKRGLTIQHLLTMTAGIHWPTRGPRSELLMDRLRRSPDWGAFILGLSVRAGDLGRFQYSSALSHLLSIILTRATGKTARDYALEHLFKPLGIVLAPSGQQGGYSQEAVFRNQNVDWTHDPQGHSTGGWGLRLRLGDMARFGTLICRGGRWKNQQLISREWIEDSLTPHTPGYGYQWWLKKAHGLQVSYAAGQGGSHIYCIPAQDLVAAVASSPKSRWPDRWELIKDYLLPLAGD